MKSLEDGDRNTDFFPGKFSNVANVFKVSRNTVINFTEHSTESGRNGGNDSHVTQGDLQVNENAKETGRLYH